MKTEKVNKQIVESVREILKKKKEVKIRKGRLDEKCGNNETDEGSEVEMSCAE